MEKPDNFLKSLQPIIFIINVFIRQILDIGTRRQSFLIKCISIEQTTSTKSFSIMIINIKCTKKLFFGKMSKYLIANQATSQFVPDKPALCRIRKIRYLHLLYMSLLIDRVVIVICRGDLDDPNNLHIPRPRFVPRIVPILNKTDVGIRLFDLNSFVVCLASCLSDVVPEPEVAVVVLVVVAPGVDVVEAVVVGVAPVRVSVILVL